MRTELIRSATSALATARSGRARVSLAVALAVASLVAAPLAHAQSGSKGAPKAPPRTDYRAAFATVQDIADGRKIAQASCAGCHGEDGISSNPNIPHLAGQRPVYMHIELNAYRTGARAATAMEGVLKRYLSEDALVNLSAYYASLDPPQPVGSAVSSPADPIAAGKKAAEACTGCHGERGTSSIAGIPNLTGFDPKYFVLATRAYQNGQRKDDSMKAIAEGLGDADLNNMALYYAFEKPERAQTPAGTGDAARGRAAAAACAGCHGETGVSGSAANPSVAGHDAEYLVLAMKAYKDGSRTDETMRNAMANIDDKAIADMATFYASQQPKAPNVRKPLTTAEWVQRCDRCHGPNGNSTDPRVPALAAQRVEYLERVLASYRTRARKSTEMAAMTDGLSEADIKNLAAYYARQKARAVIFVAVPNR